MRKLFILGLSFCLLLVGTVQTASAQDEKATSVLKSAKAKFDAMPDFAANFKYTLTNANSKGTSKSGKIKYKKGKFRVEMSDQELYCDQRRLWIFLKKDNEVNITPYDSNGGLDIQEIFKTYQQSSKARYESEEIVHGVACHKVYIASTSSKSDYNQVRIWINKSNHYLEKAELTDRRQVKTIYEFTDIKSNNGFSDSEFKFDLTKHPNVQVYDETN